MKMIFGFLLMLAFASGCSSSPRMAQITLVPPNFHQYTVKDISGNDFALSQLKGKKVLVVNVASKCGLTKQYKELQALYEKYQNDNFIIIGFPCNDFRGQEPGSNEEIAAFCKLNYGVTFPMMGKISVKKGENQAPVYQWLTEKRLNGVCDAPVTWNFQKFMINPDGSLAGTLAPKVNPNEPRLIRWIEGKSSSVSEN